MRGDQFQHRRTGLHPFARLGEFAADDAGERRDHRVPLHGLCLPIAFGLETLQGSGVRTHVRLGAAQLEFGQGPVEIEQRLVLLDAVAGIDVHRGHQSADARG